MKLQPDYSNKILHVVIETVPSRREDEKRASVHGIIYRPNAVFNKVNTTSEDLYNEHFVAGKTYQTVAIETEMGPGELGGVLERRFGIFVPIHVGGIISAFTTSPVQAHRVMTDLAGNPQCYLESEEKKVHA